jgi:ferritin-like metal-binding protein YciE
MPVKTPKELFVTMLSDVRQANERTTKILQEISQAAERPDVKDALEARIWVSHKDQEAIDQCFKMIGEQPVKTAGRLQEAFVEDFRKELGEIQGPVARHLFILAKATHLIHFRIAEYVALIGMADLTGNYGVGVLLESALSDKLAFIERTRRAVRHLVEREISEKRAERKVA